MLAALDLNPRYKLPDYPTRTYADWQTGVWLDDINHLLTLNGMDWRKVRTAVELAGMKLSEHPASCRQPKTVRGTFFWTLYQMADGFVKALEREEQAEREHNKRVRVKILERADKAKARYLKLLKIAGGEVSHGGTIEPDWETRITVATDLIENNGIQWDTVLRKLLATEIIDMEELKDMIKGEVYDVKELLEAAERSSGNMNQAHEIKQFHESQRWI